MKLFYVFSIDYQLISHRRDVVEAAIAEGYDVTVVAKNTGYRDVITGMGARFVDLPINRVGTNPLEELRTLSFLYRLYRREKPDLVHHVSLKVSLWGGLAARLAKVPAVVNAINGLGVFFASGEVDSLGKRIMMKIFQFSNHRDKSVTIFQNTDDSSLFVQHRALRSEQIRLIDGSGVNLTKYKFVPEEETLPLSLLFTSRMVEEKGVLDIIEAAKLLKPQYEGRVRFQLCGLIESNPKAVNRETLERECDGEYIQYLGQRNDVLDLLRRAAVVLLPSYYREGIPKSLIEATAVGRPIITTDWVGCRETVQDGVNGFLIPIKSPATLAQKIEVLVTNKDLRRSMGEASRRIAEERFSIEMVINKHLQIYQELTQ